MVQRPNLENEVSELANEEVAVSRAAKALIKSQSALFLRYDGSEAGRSKTGRYSIYVVGV